MKISVIVPVYQSEKYLKQCVDSILGQTYKDIEIILVDDGSTDESGTICDDYASGYSNINAYHQQNMGVSNARNRGIDLAKGELLVFVDSDDFIAPQILECAASAFQNTDIDMFLFGFQTVDKNGYRLDQAYMPGIKQGRHAIEAIRPELLHLLHSHTLSAIGCKVYRCSIIKQQKIKYEEKWTFYEDMYFCLNYMKHCKQIYISNSRSYYYRQNHTQSLSAQYVANKYVSVSQTLQLFRRLLGDSFASGKIQESFLSEYYFAMWKVIYNEHLNPVCNYRYMKKLYIKIAEDPLFREGLRRLPDLKLDKLSRKEMEYIYKKKFLCSYILYRIIRVRLIGKR